VRAAYAVISRTNNAIIAANTVNPINGDGIKPSTKLFGPMDHRSRPCSIYRRLTRQHPPGFGAKAKSRAPTVPAALDHQFVLLVNLSNVSSLLFGANFR
jgi:hypothetical protein